MGQFTAGSRGRLAAPWLALLPGGVQDGRVRSECLSSGIRGLAEGIPRSIVVSMSISEDKIPVTDQGRPRGLYGQRPSKSHDEIRRREFARIAAMPERERMLEALALGAELEEILGRRGERGTHGSRKGGD